MPKDYAGIVRQTGFANIIGMHVCRKCLATPFFFDHRINSATTECCSFCKTEQLVISTNDLKEKLIDLAKRYTDDCSVYPNNDKKPLFHVINDDWRIFRESDSLRKYLEKIFTDSNTPECNPLIIPKRKTRPNCDYAGGQGANAHWDWREFENICKEFRYPPESAFDFLADTVNACIYQFHSKTKLFRARKDLEEKLICSDMGPPPPSKAGGGRMNPAGIPLHYFASDVKTALLEVRATPGEIICVGEALITSQMRFINFTENYINPVNVDFDTAITHEHCANVIGNSLSEPIPEDHRQTRYAASQVLCEYLKRQYSADGIMYPSSLSKSGYNVAIFNRNRLSPGSSRPQITQISRFRVTATDITYQQT